ncbi:MAG TPA: serine hydrolase [Streptosporangiaceae bacterium]|nr:serine hydrolase [Streptosporangiaceae bacterium]
MRHSRPGGRAATAGLLGTAVAAASIGLLALVTPAAAGTAGAGTAGAGTAGLARASRAGTPAAGGRGDAASIAVSCTSAAHRRLAARLATGIRAALRGRLSTVALRVEDRSKDLTCSLSTRMHFDSASVVKVIILGTLLRMAETQHRHLTRHEVALATAMITESDNDAASALWAEVGRGRLQYFLGRARMAETQLGPGGYWGLTLITAHDEALLLNLLMYPNTVLTPASRAFALNLMARVIPAQRWGVTAGAPADLTAHVKNGWLPLATHGWRIHSIGCFTGHHRGYSIVVLTEDNPTMQYGISTISGAAEVIHRQLSPPGTAFIRPARPAPSWGTPDERIPVQAGGR